MNVQPGRRVYCDEDGGLWLRPGDYGCSKDGEWFARPPGRPEENNLGSLEQHNVTVHEDDTITVSPSIMVTSDKADSAILFHGSLERGVWRWE